MVAFLDTPQGSLTGAVELIIHTSRSLPDTDKMVAEVIRTWLVSSDSEDYRRTTRLADTYCYLESADDRLVVVRWFSSMDGTGP